MIILIWCLGTLAIAMWVEPDKEDIICLVWSVAMIAFALGRYG